MKYMGSKQALLTGPLGALLLRECSRAERFFDLFSGSGAVTAFVGSRLPIPVVAADLQAFACHLAADVVGRTSPLDLDLMETKWLDQAAAQLAADERVVQMAGPLDNLSERDVFSFRRMCSRLDGGFIWRDYGGHYFSPSQAAKLDHLHEGLPEGGPERRLALACLIRVASRCAAAPGHTAQPFQPKPTSLPYIQEAWKRDPLAEARRAMQIWCNVHAKVQGSAVVADALAVAASASSSDVVFVDPPYSEAQYSRFYHVLEGIAIGGFAEVFGTGRAPTRSLRCTSRFSMRKHAHGELEVLLDSLRETKATVVLTFPARGASNGIEGRQLAEIARKRFNLRRYSATLTHSTLGGTRTRRAPRLQVNEIIYLLKPR